MYRRFIHTCISGSSPEPSQSVSSPSRIPKSRSTPPSRKNSPSRTLSSKPGKPPAPRAVTVSRNNSRSQSRIQSRIQSRVGSRETSPTKTPKTPISPRMPVSPSKIPIQKYKHVQAKVNSLNKPKVPPKPQVLSEQSEDSESARNVKHKKPLNRKDSVNRSRTNSNFNLLPKTGTHSKTNDTNLNSMNSKPNNITNNNNSNNNNNNVTKRTPKGNVGDNKTSSKNNNSTKTPILNKKTRSDEESTKKNNNLTMKQSETNNIESISSISNKKYDPSNNLNNNKDELSKNLADSDADVLPSTNAVVSSTTSTVTQPLNIEATLNPSKQTFSKPVSPMIDGRVLSATSVSNAINKMNDTILDTKTIIRDHGLNKIAPSSNSVVSAASESTMTNVGDSLGMKSIPEVPAQENAESTATNAKLTQNNHTNHVGLGVSSKDLEMEVQRNLNRLINTDLARTNSAQRTINDTIKQARPDLPSDVKPIRINVKEKPSDVEVQSGNVRLPISVSNGLNDRPG